MFFIGGYGGFQHIKRRFIEKYDVAFQIIGDKTLLPPHLRKKIVDFEYRQDKMFHKAQRYTMNVCIAYTSRWEMIEAMHSAIKVTNGQFTESDIENHLLIDSPDIIIRTSGEYRLSDFLLWQVIHIPQNFKILKF
jgi:undecaprenyl diphosphate synthase